MSQPLLVEIVAYAPTAFYHCTHCEVAWRTAGVSNRLHDEQVAASLPPDLAADYGTISDWVRDLFGRHCDRIAVKVVDAASIEGVFKTLRHGLRRYPAVIVDRKARFAGALREVLAAAAAEVSRRLAQPQGMAR